MLSTGSRVAALARPDTAVDEAAGPLLDAPAAVLVGDVDVDARLRADRDRLLAPAQMLYLFLQSMVPTIPGGWLTFAENPVYKIYDRPVGCGASASSPTSKPPARS